MSKKQNKKTNKQVIILIENRETKQKHRTLLGNKKTQICFETRGDWHTDRTHREPLSALIEQGIYKLANIRARQIYNEYFKIDAQQTTADMEEEEAQIWKQIAEENAERIYEAEPEQEEEMEADESIMEGDNDCPRRTSQRRNTHQLRMQPNLNKPLHLSECAKRSAWPSYRGKQSRSPSRKILR